MRQYPALVLALWFLVLITGNYLLQRPLWLDEQCVLNNIIGLKGWQLFSRPLLSNQEFPRLYLWIIQQFSALFDCHLWALRFFAWISMGAAFGVWIIIAKRVFGYASDLALFIACWCASMPLVYHAAELKMYSADVLAAGLITLSLLNNGRFYSLLPLLGLFSYAALFLCLLPFYNLILDSFLERRWLPRLTLYLVVYGLVLALVYSFDFRVSVHHLMEESWHDYFISFDSWKHFWGSLGKGMNNLTVRRFAENPRWVKVPSGIFMGMGLAFIFAAALRQFKKDGYRLRSAVTIAAAVFLLQLVLAALRIYPLGVPRMSLFFSPLLFMMTISGLRWLQGRWRIPGLIFKSVLGAYLIFVSSGVAWDIFVAKDLGGQSALFSHAP